MIKRMEHDTYVHKSARVFFRTIKLPSEELDGFLEERAQFAIQCIRLCLSNHVKVDVASLHETERMLDASCMTTIERNITQKTVQDEIELLHIGIKYEVSYNALMPHALMLLNNGFGIPTDMLSVLKRKIQLVKLREARYAFEERDERERFDEMIKDVASERDMMSHVGPEKFMR
jgi:hypothetical protein